MNSEALLGSALDGIVAVESGDERGEFAGLLLGSLGAEVIKLEGPGGSASRRIGPFTTPDHNPEHSLHFARYNLGKQSVSADVNSTDGTALLRRLAGRADVIIDSGDAADVDRRMELYRAAQSANPRLIICTITPFGLDGPYCDLKMTDLTHLAMGG
ncbi:MAG: CoA transferase, partial [Candidatus Binataceae bacterium]